jgi:hypothetical protein
MAKELNLSSSEIVFRRSRARFSGDNPNSSIQAAVC